MLPWNAEDLTFDETRFRGKVRLFPLPNLVMYPHVMQPLNVFEPRYLDMLHEALDSDGLIAMSVLMPRAATDSLGDPPVFPYTCVGKIVTHQRQDNGHYNLLLLGMRRARIEMELPLERTYREAQVELLDDYCLEENDQDRLDIQSTLSQRFQECMPQAQSVSPTMSELLSSEIPLSVLTDLVSFAMPFDFDTKCQLLAASDVDLRAKTLIDAMDRLSFQQEEAPSRKGYPPPFSMN